MVFISQIVRDYIQRHITPVSAKYTYPGEDGINPAFEVIHDLKYNLSLNEKRIFVFRSDFSLVTGIKNANKELGYNGLRDAFDEELYSHIDWSNRYGHPSLARADFHYDGRVFYAGFICQRESELQVFLSSGRYHRYKRKCDGITPLTFKQRELLEAVVAKQFQKTYGEQSIVFYDTTPGTQDDEDSEYFFTDHAFPEKKPKRIYTKKSISLILSIYESTNKRIAKQVLFWKDAFSKAKIINHDSRAKAYIRNNIIPVKPRYTYGNENGINPAYQNIEAVRSPLRLNEKRIWVLRSDFILATGVKNAYQEEFAYEGLKETFEPELLQYINLEDRYGHPSLTVPHEGYDGSVYYAGYICQRAGYLQVFLASGRFNRADLDKQQTNILEAYVARQFQRAYGKQDIIFDYAELDNMAYHATFFAGGTFPEGNPQRRYTVLSIESILSGREDIAGSNISKQISFFENLASRC